MTTAQSVRAHLLLIVGVFACATAVIYIKQSSLPTTLIVSHRLLLAAAMLSPVYMVAKAKGHATIVATFKRAVPGAVFLSAHFLTWVYAARITTAANSTLIVNLVPVTMPFILLATTGEKITIYEIIGSILSLGGVLVLAMKGFQPDPTTARGDAICFGSMLLFSFYLVVAKRSRRVDSKEPESIWLYVIPLYWIAGFLCLGIAVATSPRPWFALPHNEWILLLKLAVIPTVVGHSTLNYAMQVLRGQTVSIFNLGQFIFAGVLAYFMLGEHPTARFYVAGLLIVAGAIIIVCTAPKAAVPDELPD